VWLSSVTCRVVRYETPFILQYPPSPPRSLSRPLLNGGIVGRQMMPPGVIGLKWRLLRGGGTSAGCAVGLGIVGRAADVELTPLLVAAWLPSLAIPVVMSFVLTSAEARYRRDFLYGTGWYIFSLAAGVGVVSWMVKGGWAEGSGNAVNWIYAFPAAAMMFAFGVLHHHTALADLMTPGVGVLGGLRQVVHPRKRFLSVVLLAAVPVFLLLRLGASYISRW
jgi:hypothetical protein